MKVLTGLLILFLASTGFSSEKWGYEMYPTIDSLNIGPFEIQIDSMRSGGYCKDYVMHLVIKNKTDSVQTFNTDLVELVDKESGLTYYSISKDKESVSVPASMTGVITRTSIKPQRAISGFIWFVTPKGKADNKTKELYINDQLCTNIEELTREVKKEMKKKRKKEKKS